MLRSSIVLSLAFLFAIPSLAQSPPPAKRMKMTRTVEALRFVDSKESSASFEQGSVVTELVREGSMVRVQSGRSFGWVPADSLAEAAGFAAPPPKSPSLPPPADAKSLPLEVKIGE